MNWRRHAVSPRPESGGFLNPNFLEADLRRDTPSRRSLWCFAWLLSRRFESQWRRSGHQSVQVCLWRYGAPPQPTRQLWHNRPVRKKRTVSRQSVLSKTERLFDEWFVCHRMSTDKKFAANDISCRNSICALEPRDKRNVAAFSFDENVRVNDPWHFRIPDQVFRVRWL